MHVSKIFLLQILIVWLVLWFQHIGFQLTGIFLATMWKNRLPLHNRLFSIQLSCTEKQWKLTFDVATAEKEPIFASILSQIAEFHQYLIARYPKHPAPTTSCFLLQSLQPKTPDFEGTEEVTRKPTLKVLPN